MEYIYARRAILLGAFYVCLPQALRLWLGDICFAIWKETFAQNINNKKIKGSSMLPKKSRFPLGYNGRCFISINTSGNTPGSFQLA